jgi:hypothetical protein
MNPVTVKELKGIVDYFYGINFKRIKIPRGLYCLADFLGEVGSLMRDNIQRGLDKKRWF